MRVLMVTTDYPPMSGGIQLLCERLVRHSGHAYEVVCIGASDGTSLHRAAARETRIPLLPSHAASVAALNGAGLARALADRPSAIVSGHIVAAPAALAVQRMLGAPVVQCLYALELAARAQLTRVATQRAAASVAISSHTRDLAISCGAPPERVHLINPGVDLPLTASRPDRGGKQPLVLTVARLEDRYKGFDVMLRALPLIRAKVPDVRWVVVGEGSLRAELQASAAVLGMAETVTFTGSVSDEERDAWLARADIFAMPSRLLPGGTGGEGFGIVYLEAAAHHLPVVAGNVGGAVDAVQDGETGLLVDPTDHVAVASAITTLLIDRDLARRLGEAGRRRAEAQSWQRMASEVDDLIETLISPEATRRRRPASCAAPPRSR